ncbi:VWA domain-containing protein [Oceanicoccus sagamiensis]|uniref:VWFA domain-containing protein n=1 Tax=Oceanicoccus sagamiensis TaxID=716816 RepID=A0A1X9N520_9GAMM|nr:VWA domain-containing protein [Oceanicoccus sagamiensis]ARN72826.1 hypothetical protein BST96_01115 [Oceanicoccus sagamiensis]
MAMIKVAMLKQLMMFKQCGNSSREAKMKLMTANRLTISGLGLLISMLAAPLSTADDIDIYFSDSSQYSALGIKPNILFILDTSGSMDNDDVGSSVTLPADDVTNDEFPTNTGERRISHMKAAVYDFLADSALMDDVNVGIMRFNRKGAGVVYPVSEGDTYNSQLNDSLEEMKIGSTNTPIVNALYEAALYYTGGYVYYGISRGTEGDPNDIYYTKGGSLRADEFRTSHEDSVVTGGSGTLNTPSGCSLSDLNDDDCKDRRWEASGSALSPGQTTVQYKSPMVNACQPNHLVLLTDGNATQNQAANLSARFAGLADSSECTSTGDDDELCGAELLSYLKNTDQVDDAEMQYDQTVTTHVIGFNFSSDWLQELATAGGGLYKEASSAGDLSDVLAAISTQVLDTSSTFAAPVATINQFNRLVQRNEVYFAVFKPDTDKRWEGNIKKYNLGTVGTTSNVILDKNGVEAVDTNTGFFKESSQDFFDSGAVPTEFTVENGGVASNIPAERNVYTWFGSNNNLYGEDGPNYVNRIHDDNASITKTLLGDAAMSDAERTALIEWAKGIDLYDIDNDGDRTLTRKSIGDPLHSKPVVVTYGGTNASPILTMFFGTNEGYFHAVDANTGEELWSFIPQELLGNLADVSSGQGGDHIYGVDGAPTVWINDVDDDGVIGGGANGAKDFVYVYFGLRRGGTTYYAMDVTNRNSPKMLWQISRGDSGFEDLGETWSQPIITVVGEDDGSNNKGNNGDGDIYDILGVNARHVLFFAGGYDPDQDNDTDGVDNLNRNTDTQGNAIYMVDAQTGALLWRADDTSYPDMDYSIPATLTVADTTGSSFANQFYVGDMGGQIWRFDINTGGELGSSYINNTDFISGGVIAELAGDTDSTARRFYQSPDIALINEDSGDSVALTIGSGWRASPNETAVLDRFYMLKLSDAYSAPESGYIKLDHDDLYDATADLITSSDASGKATELEKLAAESGWYITLGTAIGNGSGEKVLSTPLTINGVVLFATYEPTSRLVDCAPTPGTARAYAVNLYDATSASKNDTNRFETLNSGTIVDEPVVVITQNTDPDSGEISTSGAVKFGTEDPSLDDNLLGNDLATRTFWYQKE